MENWLRVKELFAAAADLPAAARPGFLDSACAGNIGLREEVDSLLAADDTAADLASVVKDQAGRFLQDDALLGERLGAYRIVREIGRGGMGSVFLAVRDDDEYHSEVAIKVVRRGMDSADLLKRFRRERQILAGLDHPYIARLLDGGADPAGRPFLVMEHVRGEALDDYLAHHPLTVRERCDLFLRICEGVAHAHQRLVAHLDLKPGNIMVTPEGVPKLLDFGVAKLLEFNDGSAASPRTDVARPLTLEYASPEQLRGLPASTATDVYTLGAILYEMLAGRRAQQFASRSPLDIERVVCDVDPTPLSQIRPRLAGPVRDLEAVIAKAMRKEAPLRYSSVEQFAADLERCWTGMPVLARQGSFTYRTRKLLIRNRVPLAVGAVVLATLTAATVVSVSQARRAGFEQLRAEQESRTARSNEARAAASQREAERQAREADRQAREAERQRVTADQQTRLADRRFRQVRDLAGKFLLDFHDSISRLPGSTAARKKVVETGLAYYDTLVRDAQGNPALLAEIARGYDRLGDAQGNPYFANLGDSKGALASYEKAAAIRRGIVDSSVQFQNDRLQGMIRIGQLKVMRGEISAGIAALRETIGDARAAFARHPDAFRGTLSDALRAYGDTFFRTGDFAGALQPFHEVLALVSGGAPGGDPVATQRQIGQAHAKLADAYVRLHRGPEALNHIRTSIATFRNLTEAQPDNTALLRMLYSSYAILGLIYKETPSLGSTDDARGAVETAAQMAERMLAADPNDKLPLFDVMASQSLVGDFFRDHGDPAAAVEPYRRAVASIEKYAAGNPPALLSYDALVFAHQRLASGLGRSGQLDQALDEIARAESYLADAEKLSPGSIQIASRRADLIVTRAEAFARRQNWPEAIQHYSDAIRALSSLAGRDPRNQSYPRSTRAARKQLSAAYAAIGRSDLAAATLEALLADIERTPANELSADERKDRDETRARLNELSKR